MPKAPFTFDDIRDVVKHDVCWNNKYIYLFVYINYIDNFNFYDIRDLVNKKWVQ